MVQVAGIAVGPKSHFTEEKTGSGKVSSLSKVTWRMRQWGARSLTRTPR